jgi:hypothetical protein
MSSKFSNGRNQIMKFNEGAYKTKVQTYIKNKLSRVEIVPIDNMTTSYWSNLNCELDHAKENLSVEIFKSPFQVETECYQTDDLKNFIKILKYMIDIKCGTGDAISTIASAKPVIGKIVKSTYECLVNMDIVSFLKLGSNLGNFVKLSHDNIFAFKGITKATLLKTKCNKYLFQQMMMLFSLNKFHGMWKEADLEEYNTQTLLAQLISDANLALKSMNFDITVDVPYDVKNSQVMQALFDTSYFKPLATFLLRDVPIVKNIKNPNAVVGVMMGMALENKRMIRHYLTEILGTDLKPNYLNGIFGMITHDMNLLPDIKFTAARLDLDPNLLLQFIELGSTDLTQTYHTAHSLCKE